VSYDLVTLLIGVMNQYQGKPIEVYSRKVSELLKKAIAWVYAIKNVVVISIPDYAYTPFCGGEKYKIKFLGN